jgi:hypothetical protein
MGFASNAASCKRRTISGHSRRNGVALKPKTAKKNTKKTNNKKMTKTTTPNYCNQIVYNMERKTNKSHPLEVQHSKHELIRLVLLEVKRSTQVITDYNTLFFADKFNIGGTPPLDPFITKTSFLTPYEPYPTHQSPTKTIFRRVAF